MTEERSQKDPQAERILIGDTAGVGDSYRRVAEMLEALKTVQAVDSVREKATVAAMKAAIESPEEVRSLTTPNTTTPRRAMRRIKVAAVAIAGMLALMTSLAFAGGLPGAAQDTANDFFGSFGIDIPAGDNAPDAADSRGDQADDARQDGEQDGVSTQDAEEGSQISEDAKNITEDGDGEYLDDAADLAEDASDGKSTTGTDTAEESADGAGPETGQEAAEDGSGNSDNFSPR